jgi:hypothetical protein
MHKLYVHGFTLAFDAAMFEDLLNPHLKSFVILLT